MTQPFLEQRLVLDSGTPFKVVEADRRAGKTTLCGMFIERQPLDSRILFLVPDYAMLNYTRRQLGYVVKPHLVDFMTPDSEKWRGGRWDVLVADEAQYLPPDFPLKGIYGTNPKAFIIGTPDPLHPNLLDKAFRWAFRQRIDVARVWRIGAQLNPYLEKSMFRELEQLYSPEKLWYEFGISMGQWKD